MGYQQNLKSFKCEILLWYIDSSERMTDSCG